MRSSKKLNKRQLAYSKNKTLQAREGLYRNFLLCILAIFALVAVTAAFSSNPIGWDTIVTTLTGSGVLATMAAIGNMAEISDKESSPNQIGMRLWLIAVEQVDQTQAFPTPNADRELGTIPLSAGEIPHYFDVIPDTIDETGTATKGDIITEFLKSFICIVAGNRAKHMDFIENYAGKGFILIYSLGEDGTKYVVGSVYKPMVLQVSDRKGGGKEGRYITFTFQNKHWRQPLIYTGSISVAAPATVAANATNIPITSATQYRLSDHSGVATIATVSGVGSADVGRVIEILAPATVTNAPQIEESSTFVLKSGTTWTANVGSRISFKIYDLSTLVEVDGSRVQTA